MISASVQGPSDQCCGIDPAEDLFSQFLFLLTVPAPTILGWAYTMFPARVGVLYASQHGLYTIDPLDLSTSLVGALEHSAMGLAVHPSSNELYATSSQGTSHTGLYRICAENLDMVPVAILPLGNLTAFAFGRKGQLYGGTSDGRLYHINPDSGDTTLVGVSSLGGYNCFSMNPITDTLWAASWPFPLDQRDGIFTVNKFTGEGSLVGHVGENLPVRSLAFGPDGTLYGLRIISGGAMLVRIDTVTGEGMTLGSLDVTDIIAIAMRTDTITTAVKHDYEEIPLKYTRAQNYPNPFNPSTTIRYGLPQRSHVRLIVFNALGQEVAELVNGEVEGGYHEVKFDASALSSGVYIYRLTAGSFVETRKLLLVH